MSARQSYLALATSDVATLIDVVSGTSISIVCNRAAGMADWVYDHSLSELRGHEVDRVICRCVAAKVCEVSELMLPGRVRVATVLLAVSEL